MLNIHPVERPSVGRIEPLLVDAPTAAKLLAIGERTLWRLSHQGKITPVKIGRTVRYAVSDLQLFIARARSAEPVSAAPNETGDDSKAIARPV